jgi:DNA-directed RNA polymerase subunit M/transcription elongation factor TFIIS
MNIHEQMRASLRDGNNQIAAIVAEMDDFARAKSNPSLSDETSKNFLRAYIEDSTSYIERASRIDAESSILHVSDAKKQILALRRFLPREKPVTKPEKRIITDEKLKRWAQIDEEVKQNIQNEQPTEPAESQIRGKCPECGDHLVSNLYYIAGEGYLIKWECWGGTSRGTNCKYSRVL